MTEDYFEEGMDIPSYIGGPCNYPSVVKDLMEKADEDAEHVSARNGAVSKYSEPVLATA